MGYALSPTKRQRAIGRTAILTSTLLVYACCLAGNACPEGFISEPSISAGEDFRRLSHAQSTHVKPFKQPSAVPPSALDSPDIILKYRCHAGEEPSDSTGGPSQHWQGGCSIMGDQDGPATLSWHDQGMNHMCMLSDPAGFNTI